MFHRITITNYIKIQLNYNLQFQKKYEATDVW